MKLKSLALSAFTLIFVTPAFASVLESGERHVETKIAYAVMSVEAKCRAPRWEDDPFTPYFSSKDYPLIQKYIDEGYDYKLIDRTCGVGGETELSATNFERVKILFLNGDAARKDVEEHIRKLLNDF